MNNYNTLLAKMKTGVRFLLAGTGLLFANSATAQINIYPNQTALTMAQTLVGPGVTIANATFTCPTTANGLFGVVNASLGLDSGIVMTSGRAQTAGAAIGVNGVTNLFASNSNGAAGDADLTTISGQNTFDACKLEFDFTPAGDTIKFDYVFGSEEYNGINNGNNANFNCSINDVFAFIISGPNIVGSQNIALVPGTTVPVGVSTINDGVWPGGTANTPCNTLTNNNGPYTQYYVSNANNPNLTYSGHTVVLTAIKAVTPCTTYHLKLAIADASDGIYDSGVFLKAGSLTSNAVSVRPVGGGGLSAPVPYCVRGCSPGQFVFTRPQPKTTPLTIHYQIAGSAVNGTDYTTITDSVVIPANATAATKLIYGLPTGVPTGPKTVKLLILSPYSCGAGNTPIIDSAQLIIYDSLQVSILTPDTAICRYDSVHIQTQGDTLLSFNWTPATGLDSPTSKHPIASPLTTTTYTLNASLPGSGCAAVHKSITVTIKQPPVVDAGPDRTTCLGTPFQFHVTTTPNTQTYSYTWVPFGLNNLNDTTISDPIFTPTITGTAFTYAIIANPGAIGCSGYDTVSVRVLPNDFTLFTPDTAICQGVSINVQGQGDPAFQYSWTPTAGVSDSTSLTPIITADTSATYTVTASYPTCPDITHGFHIDVQPNPVVYVGPDRAICQWDTIQIEPVVTPTWYTHYIYNWSPATHINDPSAANIVFNGEQDTTLTLTVTTPAGCKGSDDMAVIVHPGNFASMTPADTAICPLDTVRIHAMGGVSYQWSPNQYLDNATSADPVSYPVNDIYYTGLVTNEFGCKDTLNLNIVVHPNAVISLPDTTLLYPGESVTMNPGGNCSYYEWFPPLGLSATNISNPIAMPPVNTRYIVKAKTEFGCAAIDTTVIMVTETVIDIPNAFSPGSAPNDILKINKRGIASLKYFRIFNRWGTKVFETTDIDQGWDGRWNGSPQPMGVYVYMIEAYTTEGRRFYKQGNVTLIR